jgi:phosphoglycerate dehydrogenase-like enzyme
MYPGMSKVPVIIPRDKLLAACFDAVAERLAQAGLEVLRPDALLPRDWSSELARAEVLVLTPRHPVTRGELAAAPRLKGIVFPTIGVEALDLDAANALGIAVGHGATPELVNSMAEANVLLFAALLLDLGGKQRAVRERGWRDGTLRARMVEGKTIGFVGFGRIAQATVRRLVGWGVRVLYYDPYVREVADLGTTAVRVDDLARLLGASDVVSVLVELTAETAGLIGEAELRLMKPDAFLVNTGRGAVVDEAALARALRDGMIAGAALDAFAAEPLAADSPLRSLDNVILTPHNIGHTREQTQSFVSATCENILRLARGEPPLYFKNLQVLAKWRERLARLARE